MATKTASKTEKEEKSKKRPMLAFSANDRVRSAVEQYRQKVASDPTFPQTVSQAAALRALVILGLQSQGIQLVA